MSKRRRIALLILCLALIATSGFVIWGSTPARPMAEALAALQSSDQVEVRTNSWLVFMQRNTQPTTGFIIYPGGRVDYRAYAPLAHQIAAEGYLVVIVRMPLNLAVLNPGAADKVIKAYPGIQHWVVGGHSLGGAMAANFARKHLNEVQGLVLWAAYPAGSDDLSTSSLKVVSISGSEDGLATKEKIDASRALLPGGTQWVVVEGGNHAQFGWYGEQAGDNPAKISRLDQQNQIQVATLSLMAKFK